LLKQPVYIPFRPLKDPREIRLLDPACGSMHFGLYAFDLYERIYAEAWDLEQQQRELERSAELKPLAATYSDKEAFLRDVPRLIIEYNIHGIDIDPRAAQIAGLSLWLRAQKSWHFQTIKSQDRPKIKKSNIVCAEPMPGEDTLLAEFIEIHLSETSEHKTIANLLFQIFKLMKIAGESGFLLNLEEEIRIVIRDLSGEWGGIFENQDQFRWQSMEQQVLESLKKYSQLAITSEQLQRRLFANDAVQGFAFIDLCKKKFDVILMNPPFGESTSRLVPILAEKFKLAIKNLYIAFLLQGQSMLTQDGLLGAITDATFIHQNRYEKFRRSLLSKKDKNIHLMSANGWGVLDSYVETASLILAKSQGSPSLFFDLRNSQEERQTLLQKSCADLNNGHVNKYTHIAYLETFTQIPKSSLVFWLPHKILSLYRMGKHLAPNMINPRCGMASQDNPRFYKLWWEINSHDVGREKIWSFLSNGGEPCPLFRQQVYLVNYKNDGYEVKQFVRDKLGSDSRTIINQSYYFQSGLTYGKRTESFTVQYLPEGQVFSNEGQAIFFCTKSYEKQLIAYLNSSLVAYILNSIAGQHKESGYVANLPQPPKTFLNSSTIKGYINKAHKIAIQLSESVLESQFFSSPWAYIENEVPNSISEVSERLNSCFGEVARPESPALA